MTRTFRATGDAPPAKPPNFPYKPPANSPPRRKPKPMLLPQNDPPAA